MEHWQNWSGRHQVDLKHLRFIRSEEDAAGVVNLTRGAGGSLRVAGSGHSHSLLVPHTDTIVDASGLAGVIETNREDKTAWVFAGSKIYSLGRPLHDAGLALKNQGDIDRQAIAGACATGTHGTGRALGNLSSAVLGARVVLASGEIVDCGPGEREELWQAIRLNLGAVGLVTRLKLQCREAYRLREAGFQATYDEVFPRIPELIEAHDRFEFFWYPGNDKATVKVIEETDDPAEYPLAAEGGRCAWNYEVLPSHRPHPHTEMEYSVPLEAGPECFAAIRALLHTRFTDVRWPVEYRTVAADDVWLSMAHGRPTVTISVHQDIRQDETGYYQACEEIFLAHEGRPHWGKVNYLDGDQLSAIHPRWSDWWEVRDRYDPDGVFLNDYLTSIAPGRSS